MWEAKHRKRVDFTRTTFHETNDVAKIRSLIAGYTDVAVGSDADFGLTQISRFQTKREVYLVDEKFSVMLDATDFGHWVGEVEKHAHSDIDAFMLRYAWFFVQERKPKGKLTAYFERFGYSRDGYRRPTFSHQNKVRLPVTDSCT